MAGDKAEVLLVGPLKPRIVEGLSAVFTLHTLTTAKDGEAFIKEVGPKIRAIAIAYTANKLDAAFMSKFPKLEQISSFGVGYDHVDAKHAGERGIVVTNTPEVLNEEVADTTLGRVLFNELLPEDYPFVDYEVGKKQLSEIVNDLFESRRIAVQRGVDVDRRRHHTKTQDACVRTGREVHTGDAPDRAGV